MTFFWKAKHWQLFILTTGILIVFQIVWFSGFFSIIQDSMIHGVQPDPGKLFSRAIYFPFAVMLNLGIMNGWMWSIGVGLQHRIPEEFRMSVTKFKLSLIFTLSYLTLLFCGIAYAFTWAIDMVQTAPPDFSEEDVMFYFGMFALIFPIHMFCIFCTFYNLYFVAKTFKMAELQKDLKFEQYMAEFFLIWFFAIGVWILQPKLNKMVKEFEGGQGTV